MTFFAALYMLISCLLTLLFDAWLLHIGFVAALITLAVLLPPTGITWISFSHSSRA